MTPQWLAGWFEARGHIEVYAGTVRRGDSVVRRDRFGVVLCGPLELVQSLAARHGGHWRSRPAGRAAPDVRWRATGEDAARFLALIQPHVLLRRAELETAALFYATMNRRHGSRSVPGPVARRRDQLAGIMDSLRPRRKGYKQARARAREMRAACG